MDREHFFGADWLREIRSIRVLGPLCTTRALVVCVSARAKAKDLDRGLRAEASA
jgi:hypothetical protein